MLDNGSDVNVLNFDFELPIHYAAKGGNEDIINLLINHDATVNVRNRIDWTPLFYSVLNGNGSVVNALLSHENEDFSLNDIDALGRTVAHICAEKGKNLSIYKSHLAITVDISTIVKFERKYSRVSP